VSPTSELNAYFEDLASRDAFSGVVLVTSGASRLYAGEYGYASRAWKVPNTLETRFDTASITKLFTAVATMQLVDRGLLTMDTGVIDFLGLTGTRISPDVTVYQLLTHTSGIGDDSEEEDGEDYEDVWVERPNYSVTETRDFLPQFVHKEPNFPPGEGCRYCNCGYVLLGLMIEKCTGLSYRRYVQENVFDRAGMARSGFFRMDRVHEGVAEGADPIRDALGAVAGWKRNVFSFPPVGSPDSGAHVTAGDLDRFLRAVKAGDILSPELTEAFFTPQVPYREKDGWTMVYGHGLWFRVEPPGGVVCCQKEGYNAGVSGMIRYFPARDISVVILSNMAGGAWKPIERIHEMVVASRFDGAAGG
jgi:CubicO group peptidase (beta-lactamase class C family)